MTVSYEALIESFMYEAAPVFAASDDAKFEAVYREILSTKQRRFGPIPPPEQLVPIRDVVRTAQEQKDKSGHGGLQFMVPWGCSKQDAGQPLDIAEFFALKQLLSLREGLARLDYQAEFFFRLEDLTDAYLLGDDRTSQVESYSIQFSRLTEAILPRSFVQLESDFVSPKEFRAEADRLVDAFHRYLLIPSEENRVILQELGWHGDLHPEQVEYYMKAYQSLFLGEEYAAHLYRVARYFAATLARVKLGATCAPLKGKAITIAFTHPIPRNPVSRARVHYRAFPDSYTHVHKSPWIGRAYFLISDRDGQNCIKPKWWTPDCPHEIIEHQIRIGKAVVQANYAVE